MRFPLNIGDFNLRKNGDQNLQINSSINCLGIKILLIFPFVQISHTPVSRHFLSIRMNSDTLAPVFARYSTIQYPFSFPSLFSPSIIFLY